MKKKKVRQYRSTQGRSPKQLEKNYKVLFYSLLGLFITMLFIFLKYGFTN